MFIDRYYLILVLPAVIFALWAQHQVNGTFNKYSKVRAARNVTGAQAAQAVLQAGGVYDVRIERIAGNLTDHYDPRDKVIRLSDSVYDNPSIAALGVAAHEAGHAVQHAEEYFPLRLRRAIIPVTQIGSTLAMPLLIIGLILSSMNLVYLGIAFFGFSTLFQAVTLPVEFDASRRAVAALSEGGLLSMEELPAAKKTLRAAALTYVAALAVSMAQLFRLLLVFGGRRDD